MRKLFIFIFFSSLIFTGFAQRKVIEDEQPTCLDQNERNIKRKVAIGRFSN